MASGQSGASRAKSNYARAQIRRETIWNSAIALSDLVTTRRNMKEFANDEGAGLPVPKEGALVIVQCEGFRCMAFRDGQGKWIDAVHRTELPRVIRVVALLIS